MCRYTLLLIFAFVSVVLQAQVRNVKKGDIIEMEGVKGIVFNIDDSGMHGQMMSVKAFRALDNLYCKKASLLKKIGMSSKTNGQANTNALYSYVESNRVSLDNFPVFKWCRSLGNGWYIPSVEQLRTFINYWLGNSDVEVSWEEDEGEEDASENTDSRMKQINELLLQAGGIPFINGVFTSTINKDMTVDVFQYDADKGKWSFEKVKPKDIDAHCVGRAFYDF